MSKSVLADGVAWAKAGRVQKLAGGAWGIPPTRPEFIRAAKEFAGKVGIDEGLQGTISASIGISNVDSLAQNTWGDAKGLFESTTKDLAASIGLPPAVAGSLMHTAQAVASGDIAGAITGIGSGGITAIASAALSAIVPPPFGPLAGGLVSMGLSALFGGPSPPRPLPGKKERTITYKSPNVITMASVLEEIWLGSMRWRKGGYMGPEARLRAVDFTLVPGQPDPGKSIVAMATLPAGHAAAWRLYPDGKVYAADKKHPARPTGTDGKNLNLGQSFEFTQEDGTLIYDMEVDTLAEFVGWNTPSTRNIQERLYRHFKRFDTKPTDAMRPFRPYFSTVGWIEYIAAAAILEARRRGLFTATDYTYTDSKQIQRACEALTKPYEPKEASKTKSTDLARLAYPEQGALGALAVVTHELVAVAAAKPIFAAVGNAAEAARAARDAEFQRLVIEKLDQILATGSGAQKRAANESKTTLTPRLEKTYRQFEAATAKGKELTREKDKAIASGGTQMANALPIALGAVAIAGGMWWMNRRDSKLLQSLR